MFASRIRLSAALLLTTWLRRQRSSRTAGGSPGRRRCSAPCRASRSRWSIAATAGPRAPRCRRPSAPTPSVVGVGRADGAADRAVAAVVADEHREALRSAEAGHVGFTVDFRRGRPGIRGRAPCGHTGAGPRPTASPASRCGRAACAMLFSAPSLICRVDRPSLALRMPWFRTAWVER